MQLTLASQEAIWLRKILDKLGWPQKAPTTLLEDNQSAIALTKNSAFHPRTKHINLRYHFIREARERGDVLVRYIPTAEMTIMTKGLPRILHQRHVEGLGLTSRLSGSAEGQRGELSRWWSCREEQMRMLARTMWARSFFSLFIFY